MEENLQFLMAKDFVTETMEDGFLLVNEAVYYSPEYEFSSRIGVTREISNLSLEVTKPADFDFMKKEVYEARIPFHYAEKFYDFTMSGGTNAVEAFKDFPGVKKFIEPPKSDKLPKNFNTLYGPRIATQLPMIVEELKRSPSTRRACIMILDGQDNLLLDLDESIEYPCTLGMTYSVRDKKLNVHVAMRSQNTAIVLQLDMYLQGKLHHEIAKQVGLPVGKFMMNFISAHIYDRDFEYVEKLN